jgi:hypothetical protein
MARRFNSEFNYRTQVQGETPWAKLQSLKEFLLGRERALVLEQVSALKTEAKNLELQHLKYINALPHVILNLEAELVELRSTQDDFDENIRLCKLEVEMLKRLIAETRDIAEPTRKAGYTDEEMFEANSAFEFAVVVAKEIQADIIANGRPSSAKLHNAMSNPVSLTFCQSLGLIPMEATCIVPRLELKADVFYLGVTPEDKSDTNLLGARLWD